MRLLGLTLCLFSTLFYTPADAQFKKKKLHDYEAKVEADDSTGGSSWTTAGNTMNYIWRTENKNGFIAICGAYILSDINYFDGDRKILRNKFVTYQDKEILSDMLFFNRIKGKRKVKGKTALKDATLYCKITKEKLPKGRYTVTLEGRDTRIRI